MLLRLQGLVSAIASWTARLISPPYCEQCRKFLSQRTILCDLCIAKIVPVVSKTLSIGRYRVVVSAIGAYQTPLQELIVAKNRSYRLASVYLAQQIYQRTIFAQLPVDYLVPIPLHWTRKFWRGYNQSQVMAQTLAQLRPNLSVVEVLVRRKLTKPQVGLSKSERLANLYSAFQLNPHLDLELYQNRDLVIVDDVMTSGATLLSAIQLLAQLKPRSINVVVAARAI